MVAALEKASSGLQRKLSVADLSPQRPAAWMQVGTIGYLVLDTCTGVTVTGPTTFTYTQDQFPFAQATILTVTDALHYTIQVRSCACTMHCRQGLHSLGGSSDGLHIPPMGRCSMGVIACGHAGVVILSASLEQHHSEEH